MSDNVKLEWIEWYGGPCPVAPETMVMVEFRDGLADGPTPAFNVSELWDWKDDGDDIVRYRIAEAVNG